MWYYMWTIQEMRILDDKAKSILEGIGIGLFNTAKNGSNYKTAIQSLNYIVAL